MTVRVHELAKELNISSKELIQRLGDAGVTVKNHLSSVSEADAQRMRGSRPQKKETQGAKPGPAEPSKPAPRERQAAERLQEPKSSPRSERPSDARPQRERPQPAPGQRSQDGPPTGDAQSQRPPRPRPQGAQGPQDRNVPASSDQRSPQGYSQRDDRFNEYRPGEHRSGDRPRESGNYQGQRPPGQGYQGQRPPGQGYQGQRPPGQGYQGQRPPGQGYQGQRPPGQGVQGQRPPGERDRFSDDRPQSSQGQRFPNRPGGGRPSNTGRPAPAGRGLDKKAPTMQRIKIDGKTTELSVTEQPAKRQAPDKKKAQDNRPHTRNKISEKEIPATRRKMDRDREQKRPAPPVAPKHIIIPESITIQELASRMSRKAGEVIKILMGLGVMATINQEIDAETASIVANEMGVIAEVRIEKSMAVVEEIEDAPADLKPRPPVVTVMGHVDHGKTSLLDAIRSTNVTASEAGGITQHIGAYQVEINGQKITFLDTPGHEAFTAMRARGAQVTDVAVLVVAADDGIMPQTVEAINHAKAAKVPIVIAINKIDKEGANPERVKQELTEQGLVVEEWGGDTIAVAVSAKTQANLDTLLEMILLVAEMKDLKANPNRKATGTVIEAKLDKGKGPVSTVLVDKGTLNIGDVIIAGPVFGKIRAMVDDKGRRVKKVPPGTPVEIQGLSEVPTAGEIFHVVADEKAARQITMARINERRAEGAQQRGQISLEDLFNRIKEGEVKELNIIIKGDVQGSVEAIRESLAKLSTSAVRVNPIHGGVGAISKNDVMLASASNAIILGFNVRPDANNTKEMAEIQGVDIRLYRVIYDAINDVKAAMEGLLDPEFKEVTEGRAEVRQVFKVPKAGTVAGSYVTDGKISRSSQARLIRDGIVVTEGEIESLRRFKDDVKSVTEGYECGIGLKNFNDIKEGDVIETFTLEEVKREL